MNLKGSEVQCHRCLFWSVINNHIYIYIYILYMYINKSIALIRWISRNVNHAQTYNTYQQQISKKTNLVTWKKYKPCKIQNVSWPKIRIPSKRMSWLLCGRSQKRFSHCTRMIDRSRTAFPTKNIIFVN